MLVEGLFEIAPLPYKQPSGAAYRVVLICRAARLFGAPTRRKGLHGRAAGESQAVAAVRISGEIDPLARRQNTTILVGDIEITYLGPLPK